MSSFVLTADDGLSWQLLYTKPHAERWVEANLRKQGFAVLLPWTPGRAGLRPLFSRYVFAGVATGQRAESFAGTYGVAYVVHCGTRPARVPVDVIHAICGRMNPHGVVTSDRLEPVDSIFARQAALRVATLAKFAEAGFRVRSA